MTLTTMANVLGAVAVPLRTRAQGHGTIAPNATGTTLQCEIANLKANDFPGVVQADPAATPTGTSYDRSSGGAVPLPADPTGGGYFRLLRAKHSVEGSLSSQMGLLCDRMVGASGIVANVGTSQSITHPALPGRAPANGIGMLMLFECIAAAAGGTSPLFTFTYTNDAGGSSSSTSVSLGSTWANGLAADEALIAPFASGDKGVTAITAFQTSSAGSSAGNYAVDLVYPIAWVPLVQTGSGSNYATDTDWLTLGLPKIDPQANLCVLGVGAGSITAMCLDLELAIDG